MLFLVEMICQMPENEGVFSISPARKFFLTRKKCFLLMLAIFSLNSSNVFR